MRTPPSPSDPNAHLPSSRVSSTPIQLTSPTQSKLLTRFPALQRLHLLNPTIPLPALVLSFGILHELTAVVPVVGLFYGLRTVGGGRRVVEGFVEVERMMRGLPPSSMRESQVDELGGRMGSIGSGSNEKVEGMTAGPFASSSSSSSLSTTTIPSSSSSSSSSTSSSLPSPTSASSSSSSPPPSTWVEFWLAEGEAKITRLGQRYGLFGYDRPITTTTPTTTDVTSNRSREETSAASLLGGGGAQDEVKTRMLSTSMSRMREEEEAWKAKVEARKMKMEAGEREGEGDERAKEIAGDVANALGAYLIVKALLPIRLGASVYLSPPFAKAVINPFAKLTASSWRRFKRTMRR